MMKRKSQMKTSQVTMALKQLTGPWKDESAYVTI